MAGTAHPVEPSTVKEGNIITGHVIEKGTEENLAYATVLIVENGMGTVTGYDGHFRLKDVPAGKYTLKVQLMGYAAQTKTVVVSNEYTVDLHFVMEKEDIMMDEVVVSANRNETNRKAAPVVVNVMNSKLFETVNSTDLARSLSYQSGLRVENNCQNCGFPQVRINGLEGPYSQLLINSRPVMSALSGVYGLEQIPVSMIERVEVVRGGGSALFGANAVGGTINIITKDPINNSFQVNSTMSNLGGKTWEQYFGANASLVSKDRTYGVAFYQAYRNRNPYDADGDGFSELGKLNMNTFGLRGYYRPTQFSRLSVEYHTTNEFRRGGNKFDLQPHETDITEQTRHVINSGGLTYDIFMDEYKHKLSVYGSVQHTDRNSYYGAGMDANAYGTTDDLTAVGGAMYSGNFDRMLFAPATLTGGFEYQFNGLHDVMTGYGRDLKQYVRIAGAYLQNEWKARYLTLLAGFRLDKHNLVDNVIFSPRVNLLWKPTDRLQGRLTWSTGFRAPQAYDEDLHVAAVGGEAMMIKLADGLKPERSNSTISAVSSSLRSRAAAVAPPATPPTMTTFIYRSPFPRQGVLPNVQLPCTSARIWSLGRAPTARWVNWPFLNTSSVGMLMIWNWAASSGSSSTLTLPTAISGCSAASCSTSGPTMRQGPHQLAQKSSRTGRSACRTSCAKFALVICSTDIISSSLCWVWV